MIHSFLLIGQSNMGGRGFVSEVEPIDNENIMVLRNGKWIKAFTPINPDRVFSGVNLAESFAEAYQRDKGVTVGLIPCADGGSSLSQWSVGGLLFDHACYMAELASRTSNIAGILWHQGESECKDGRYSKYEERISVIMEAFRERLGLYDVPIILGGLGDFLGTGQRADEFSTYVYVNEALKSYANKNEMCAFASAEGLTANPDNLHFSAKALREFGLRYYEAFRKTEKKDKIFVEKPTFDDIITGLEAL